MGLGDGSGPGRREGGPGGGLSGAERVGPLRLSPLLRVRPLQQRRAQSLSPPPLGPLYPAYPLTNASLRCEYSPVPNVPHTSFRNPSAQDEPLFHYRSYASRPP